MAKTGEEFVLDYMLAFVYLLYSLLCFRLFASAETLDLSNGNSFLFLLSCAYLLTLRRGGVWDGLWIGATTGAALSILLFSFCAGAHWVTYLWLFTGLLCAGSVVAEARVARTPQS